MKKSMIMKTLKDRIRERNFKLTTQRQVVLEAFLSSRENHMSAEEVYEIVREHHPEVGLATVYRSLELFTSLDLIKKLDFGDGRSRYELAVGSVDHFHHHMICLDCGKVVEFTYDLPADIRRVIGEERGWAMVDYQLRVYGYCKKCEKKHRKELEKTAD